MNYTRKSAKAILSQFAITSVFAPLYHELNTFFDCRSTRRPRRVLSPIYMLNVASGSVEGAASVSSLTSGRFAPHFWIGLVGMGLIVPFLIEGYPVFITKKAGTSAASYALSVIRECGVLVGGFLLRYMIVLAALPVVFL